MDAKIPHVLNSNLTYSGFNWLLDNMVLYCSLVLTDMVLWLVKEICTLSPCLVCFLLLCSHSCLQKEIGLCHWCMCLSCVVAPDTWIRTAGCQFRPLLVGSIIQFDLLLRAAGAALWLWGTGICKLLISHSLVSSASSRGLRCLLPDLTDLGGCIVLLTSSWSTEKEWISYMLCWEEQRPDLCSVSRVWMSFPKGIGEPISRAKLPLNS